MHATLRSACAWRTVPAALALAIIVLSNSANAVANPSDARSSGIDQIALHVTDAARRFGIPEGWIYAVMRVESAGDRHAISPAGAMGLMQIMPATWATLRARYGLGADVYVARDNIMAGAAYLREMYDRYGSPGFLAAYNAGPGRYEAYLARRRTLPAETVAYVAKLGPVVGESQSDRSASVLPDPLAWTRATLFFARPNALADAANGTLSPSPETMSKEHRVVNLAAADHASGGLFVPLAGRNPR